MSIFIVGAGVVGLLVIFGIINWLLSLRRIVPTNEVHIVQSSKETVVYGKDVANGKGNSYYEFPEWIPSLGVSVTVLPASVFKLSLDNYEAYDKDRLPFVVDIVSFFRIENFSLASSRVLSYDELREQLLGIVQGAVRSILAKEDLENIMSERNKYGNMFTDEVASQLKEWGVESVKNIELMDIRDLHGSEVIANIMKKKKSQIEMESRVTVAENTRKAKEAEITANQAVALAQQDANRQVGLREAEVTQEVGIANEKSNQEIQAQAKITAEKEMEVEKVRTVQAAEIQKEADIVNANANKQTITINAAAAVAKAEADKQVIVFNAEANKQKIELQADADLKVATNTAKGVEATGKANAEAEKLMKQAQVAGDIQLAEKIGELKEYQDFIVRQKQVEALCEVGKEQAKNLGNAEIKIFANSGSVADGVNNAQNIFSTNTGLNVASLLESFVSTPMGAEIADKVLKTGDTVKAVETLKQGLKDFKNNKNPETKK